MLKRMFDGIAVAKDNFDIKVLSILTGYSEDAIRLAFERDRQKEQEISAKVEAIVKKRENQSEGGSKIGGKER